MKASGSSKEILILSPDKINKKQVDNQQVYKNQGFSPEKIEIADFNNFDSIG